MIEVSPIANEAEERLSLEIYNAAWPNVASHDITGVKRGWRGRGIARALKATQIGWAKANGFAELHTRNDERNAPIRRLNAEFGYRPGIGRIHLQGPLAPA